MTPYASENKQDTKPRGDEPRLLVDGQWVRGDSTEVVVAVDPTTEKRLAEVPAARAEQVDAAVSAARRAFDSGAWGRFTPRDRGRLLHRVVDALAARHEALVESLVVETGCPVSLARDLQVDAMLEHLTWYADAAVHGPAGGYEQSLPAHAGRVQSSSLLLREPIGVVAALTPYNVPYLTAAWKVGGALAAGCAAVLLPSGRSTLSTLVWARAVAEADLPDGAFSVLVGDGAVGKQLTEHPMVDMVTFTGSNAVGTQVITQAAGTVKRMVLELGGKSPNIVLPSANIDVAVGPSCLRFLRNAGQACGATTRTFVPRDEYDRYVQLTRDFFGAVQVGDPADESTVVGPLIRAEHRARVQGYVDRALGQGGVIEAGGAPTTMPTGFFMSPVLVGGVPNSAEIAQEELFGPVGVITPYDEVDQVLDMANDSRYGLNANVWGHPTEAVALARRVRSGTVTVNGGGGLRADAPFGGYRQSGIGREAGEVGFGEFFETKHVQVPAS